MALDPGGGGGVPPSGNLRAGRPRSALVFAGWKPSDVIIPEGGWNTVAMDMVVTRIEALLSQ